MTKPGEKFAMRAPLTDVSAGGFYVETMTPLPVGTEVQVSLEIGRVELYGNGVVETCHQAIGNGIAFTKMTPQNEKALLSVIDGIKMRVRRNCLTHNTPLLPSLKRCSRCWSANRS